MSILGRAVHFSVPDRTGPRIGSDRTGPVRTGPLRSGPRSEKIRKSVQRSGPGLDRGGPDRWTERAVLARCGRATILPGAKFGFLDWGMWHGRAKGHGVPVPPALSKKRAGEFLLLLSFA